MLGHEEINAKFNIKCNFLEALTIRNSIPFAWRSQISADFSEEVSHTHCCLINNKRYDVLNSSPEQWYSGWVSSLGAPFSRLEKWNDDLLPLIPSLDLDWPSIFCTPFKTSRETRLQAFAFKMVYRLTPCNKYLRQVRIMDSSTCSFCDEIDSISHFFLKCKTVRPFWEQLFQWCEDFLDLPLADLNEAELLLGVTKAGRNQRIVNWMILFAKYFIQKRKLFSQGSIPLIVFLREVRTKVHIERRACWRENKIRKFKPWQRLYDALG